MIIEDRINSALRAKKNVILVGPPGSGKTYNAFEFAHNHLKNVASSSILISDTRFFWLTINPDQQNPDNILSQDFFVLWQGIYRQAYEKIAPGDIVFFYLNDPKIQKIVAIGQCLKNEILKDENRVSIKIIKKNLHGPDILLIQSDPILMKSDPILKNIRASLTELSKNEGLKLFSLIGENSTNELYGIKFLDNFSRNIQSITFHQSYAYEEFIEGLRPVVDDGVISFKVHEGVFKSFCRLSYNSLMKMAGLTNIWEENSHVPLLNETQIESILPYIDETPFFFMIDEINRGEISRIFGELITLLEADKRLYTNKGDNVVILPYSQTTFGIPPNLYLIGTMNSSDRSIALLDIALRRRFGFIELMPNPTLIREFKNGKNNEVSDIIEKSATLLEELNKWIIKEYSRDHQIGHSYFFRLKEAVSIEDAIESIRIIWSYEITPLLQEYFYDNPKKLKLILGSSLYNEKRQEFINIDEMSDVLFIESLSKIKCN